MTIKSKEIPIDEQCACGENKGCKCKMKANLSISQRIDNNGEWRQWIKGINTSEKINPMKIFPIYNPKSGKYTVYEPFSNRYIIVDWTQMVDENPSLKFE